MPRRRYAAATQSGTTKRTRRVAPVDQGALQELDLYAENTGELYSQKKAILENIRRKRARGVYDPQKAPKLWLYWVDAAAKRYQREFGSDSPIFNKPTRVALAEELARKYASGEE
jgi:hypothetical protein